MEKNSVKNTIDMNFEKLYMNTEELKRETIKTLEVHKNFIKNYFSDEVVLEGVKDFLNTLELFKNNLKNSKLKINFYQIIYIFIVEFFFIY
jgi:hypothetical protein